VSDPRPDVGFGQCLTQRLDSSLVAARTDPAASAWAQRRDTRNTAGPAPACRRTRVGVDGPGLTKSSRGIVVYSRDNDDEARRAKVLTVDEARRIAANIARLPELLGKGERE
jgi:hypothetical protein